MARTAIEDLSDPFAALKKPNVARTQEGVSPYAPTKIEEGQEDLSDPFAALKVSSPVAVASSKPSPSLQTPPPSPGADLSDPFAALKGRTQAGTPAPPSDPRAEIQRIGEQEALTSSLSNKQVEKVYEGKFKPDGYTFDEFLSNTGQDFWNVARGGIDLIKLAANGLVNPTKTKAALKQAAPEIWKELKRSVGYNPQTDEFDWDTLIEYYKEHPGEAMMNFAGGAALAGVGARVGAKAVGTSGRVGRALETTANVLTKVGELDPGAKIIETVYVTPGRKVFEKVKHFGKSADEVAAMQKTEAFNKEALAKFYDTRDQIIEETDRLIPKTDAKTRNMLFAAKEAFATPQALKDMSEPGLTGAQFREMVNQRYKNQPELHALFFDDEGKFIGNEMLDVLNSESFIHLKQATHDMLKDVETTYLAEGLLRPEQVARRKEMPILGEQAELARRLTPEYRAGLQDELTRVETELEKGIGARSQEEFSELKSRGNQIRAELAKVQELSALSPVGAVREPPSPSNVGVASSRPAEVFRVRLAEQGFDIMDGPTQPIEKQMHGYPIVDAIRTIERETGIDWTTAMSDMKTAGKATQAVAPTQEGAINRAPTPDIPDAPTQLMRQIETGDKVDLRGAIESQPDHVTLNSIARGEQPVASAIPIADRAAEMADAISMTDEAPSVAQRVHMADLNNRLEKVRELSEYYPNAPAVNQWETAEKKASATLRGPQTTTPRSTKRYESKLIHKGKSLMVDPVKLIQSVRLTQQKHLHNINNLRWVKDQDFTYTFDKAKDAYVNRLGHVIQTDAIPKGYKEAYLDGIFNFYQKEVLDNKDFRRIMRDSPTFEDMLEKVNEKMRYQLGVSKGQRYLIPKGVEQMLTRQAVQVPDFLKWFDIPTDVWRMMVLAYRPAWLVYNTAGNVMQNMLAGNFNPANYAQALPGLKRDFEAGLLRTRAVMAGESSERGRDLSTRALRLAMQPKGVEAGLPSHYRPTAGFFDVEKRGSHIGEFGDTHSIAGRTLHEWLDAAERKRVFAAFKVPAKFMTEFNSSIERFFRSALTAKEFKAAVASRPIRQQRYLRLADRFQFTSGAFERMGQLTPAEASNVLKSVNKWMFDYQDLGPYERAYFRRIMPFYSWTKNVFKLATRLPIDHPIRARALMMAGAMLEQVRVEEDLPEHMRPGGILWDKDEKGNRRILNLTRMNIFETLNTKGLDMLHPLIGSMYEALSGRSNFTGEEINKDAFRKSVLVNFKDRLKANIPGVNFIQDVLWPMMTGEPVVQKTLAGRIRKDALGRTLPVRLDEVMLNYFGVPLKTVTAYDTDNIIDQMNQRRKTAVNARIRNDPDFEAFMRGVVASPEFQAVASDEAGQLRAQRAALAARATILGLPPAERGSLQIQIKSANNALKRLAKQSGTQRQIAAGQTPVKLTTQQKVEMRQ